jgi:hypothetical protein
LLKGNHEDYVLHAARTGQPRAAWEQQVIRHTFWTLDRVRDEIDTLAAWPDTLVIPAPDGSTLQCFHASRKGNRVGLYDSMLDDELIEHAREVKSVLCVGHTHIPFVREVDGKLVVNCGAVGMPFDRDPRASYALVEWSPEGWRAEIIRVPYDRDATLRAYRETGYLTDAGPMVPLILKELESSSSRLGIWHRRYEPLVSSGQMTVEGSVLALMAEESQPPK